MHNLWKQYIPMQKVLNHFVSCLWIIGMEMYVWRKKDQGIGRVSSAKACGRVRTWAAAFPTGQRFAVTPPGPLRAASPCPRGGARTGLPAQRCAPSGSCGLAGSAPAAPLSPPADSVRDLLRAGPAPAQAAGAPGVTSLAPFIQGCGPPPWRRRRASRGGGRPRPPVRLFLS